MFLLKYYFALVTVAVVYKLLFLTINHGNESCTAGDYINVAIYGLKHDLAIAGYFTAIPLLLAIVSIFKKTKLRRFYNCYNALIAFSAALAFVSDITLYPYWEFKLDAAAILVYIDSPSNAAASVTITHMIILAIALVVLTLAIYKLLSLICRREPNITIDSQNTKASPLNKVTQSIVYLFCGGLIFLGVRGGITESTNNVGSVFYTNKTYLNHAAVNPIFSFLYTLANLENFSEEYCFFDHKQLQKHIDGLYNHDAQLTDTLLTNTRPNIITIILEGFSAEVVEELGGMKNITPNIDRLSKEGVLFTQCYANSYRTDRGVICTLSGYPSFPKTSVMKSANKSQKLPSLASTLRSAGYTNTFLYGGDANFTNMSGYLYSTGYDRIISDADFTASERSTHRWGAGDDITFDRLYNMVINQRQTPWHITYLTLSSHEPWEVPYNRINNDEKANSFAFTDEMLGNFVEKLKKTKQWDNTLIVCIADHSVVGYPDGIKQTDKKRNHILFVLLGGAINNPRRIETLCNQTDFVATLLAQMQLPTEPFKFSRNILGPEYRYPFAYHCYNNGISLIDSTGFSVLDLDSRKELLDEPTSGGNDRIDKAKAILQTTYTDYTNL